MCLAVRASLGEIKTNSRTVALKTPLKAFRPPKRRFQFPLPKMYTKTNNIPYSIIWQQKQVKLGELELATTRQNALRGLKSEGFLSIETATVLIPKIPRNRRDYRTDHHGMGIKLGETASPGKQTYLNQTRRTHAR